MKKIEYIKKQDAIDAIVASNCNVDVDGLTAIMKVSPAVVLCKDCIFWEKGTRDDGFCFSRYVVCGSLTPRRNPTDFCSYGERKEPNV